VINLYEQILSFIFSIIYGLIVSYTYIKCYKYLYCLNKYYSMFNSFLFCLIIELLFFKVMYIINNGVINIYFIIVFLSFFILFVKKFTNKMSI